MADLSKLQGPDYAAGFGPEWAASQGVPAYSDGEFYNFVSPKKGAIKFDIPVGSVNRKLYGYIYSYVNIPSEFFVAATINFLNSGQVIASLPLSVGYGAANPNFVKQSLAGVCSSGSTPNTDALFFTPQQLLTNEPIAAYLYPQHIKVAADQITVDVVGMYSPNANRIYVGCLSNP